MHINRSNRKLQVIQSTNQSITYYRFLLIATHQSTNQSIDFPFPWHSKYTQSINQLTTTSKSVFFMNCQGLQVLMVYRTVLGDEKTNETVRWSRGWTELVDWVLVHYIPYTILYYTIHYTILYYTILYYTILCYKDNIMTFIDVSSIVCYKYASIVRQMIVLCATVWLSMVYRYIYASQPLLSRLLVISLEQMTIVQVRKGKIFFLFLFLVCFDLHFWVDFAVLCG